MPAPVDVSDDLVTFLRANLNTERVSVPFDPADDIDHANYEGSQEYPQIAVVSEDAIVAGGGLTQYSGIDPGGGGGIQDVVVSLLVDCWGGPEDEAVYRSTGVHPDRVAAELAHEVHQAATATGASSPPPGYDWLSAEPPRDADDVDREQTHYRQQVICRLKYIN